MIQLDAYMHLKTKQDPIPLQILQKAKLLGFPDGGTAGIWLQQKDFPFVARKLLFFIRFEIHCSFKKYTILEIIKSYFCWRT